MEDTPSNGSNKIVTEIGQLTSATDGPLFQMLAAYYAGILGVFALLAQSEGRQKPVVTELKNGDAQIRLKTDQLTTAIEGGRIAAAKILVFQGIMLVNTAYGWTVVSQHLVMQVNHETDRGVTRVGQVWKEFPRPVLLEYQV